MNKYSLCDHIGNTPLVQIDKSCANSANVFAKLEYLNPSGSIKDRPAFYMIKKAQEKGLIKSKKVVEATSGNMGISLAMVCAFFGYEFTAVMSENASLERREIIKHFGANVEIIPASVDYSYAVKKAKEISKNTGAWFVNQYSNPDNMFAHETTGAEILNQACGVDAFVAGIGTGGTLVGVAKAIRKKNPNALIIGVEPQEASLITNNLWTRHAIEGISVGFIADLYENNKSIVDKVMTVSSAQALVCAKELATKQGLLCGISSGANVYVARQIANQIKKGTVVTVLPDSADRYYSTKLFK